MFIVVTIILGFFLLIIIHELGHLLAARIVGIGIKEFGIGIPPTLYSKKKKGIIWSLNLFPIGGFVEIKNAQRDPFVQSISLWRRILFFGGGIICNIVLAFCILFTLFFYSPIHIENHTAQLYKSQNIYALVSTDKGEYMFNSISSSVHAAALSVTTVISDTAYGFSLFFRDVNFEDLSGPIEIIQYTYNSLEEGNRSFLFFLAFISINLAFINLLPIPGLDGWYILIAVLESITRRKFSVPVLKKISTGGLVFLISLVMIVSVFDIIS